MEIWKNITSSNLKKFAGKFFSVLNTKQEKEEGLIYVKRLKVAASSQFSLVGQLSGGNQQKVVIGKWLSKETNILFLDEPTRGVDVGAKVEMQNLIRNLAREGSSCIVVSSEIEEIQRLCDNVVVMNEGNVVAYLSTEEMTTQRLIKEFLGKG
jgi:ribose transport system ATP-binding protein